MISYFLNFAETDETKTHVQSKQPKHNRNNSKFFAKKQSLNLEMYFRRKNKQLMK